MKCTLSADWANSSIHQHKFIIMSILMGICFLFGTKMLQQ